MRKLFRYLFAALLFVPDAFAADGAFSRVVPGVNTATSTKTESKETVARTTVGRGTVARDAEKKEEAKTSSAVRGTVSRVFSGVPEQGKVVATVGRSGVAPA